ncbi:Proline iminopeptidase [Slackia heliotrinireducens]|uniref:Proline iminopeptidase n=1 Tax=Slackia heliotrinireducens (strain ATCC 29202 / DSM 20476 / NCTC 11029 / RHS 1) TaxID=471855 RepID=C7N1Y7_SLAHD|nr:proline iminopeptidase-family hydrolase [Slackia heliotrinireducens]ACV23428.1 proline-specific peptidase [Slackia heliotrinireducens DSM 20476]VEH02729.1 Proline iminopeptidase [Slackia heliotrinireducens]
MAEPKKLEIKSEVKELYVNYIPEGYEEKLAAQDYKGTYVKIVGESAPGKKPLLVLHGGPGDTHAYLYDLALIADKYQRQVIFYDQIGCGKSWCEGMGEDFYNYDLWVNEYYAVKEALGLDDFHLFGNSWGGMLGMLCMMKDDSGVNSFVINSSPVLIQAWLDAANNLIKFLPLEMQNALAEAEATGNYDTVQARAAFDEYYKRHVTGFYEKDYPEHIAYAFSHVGECYMIMQGASEFVVTGKMRDWDIREGVKNIKVPCMALSGGDDEGSPAVVKMGVDLIPNCEWTLIPGAPHICSVTHPDESCEAVENFISRFE